MLVSLPILDQIWIERSKLVIIFEKSFDIIFFFFIIFELIFIKKMTKNILIIIFFPLNSSIFTSNFNLNKIKFQLWGWIFQREERKVFINIFKKKIVLITMTRVKNMIYKSINHFLLHTYWSNHWDRDAIYRSIEIQDELRVSYKLYIFQFSKLIQIPFLFLCLNYIWFNIFQISSHRSSVLYTISYIKKSTEIVILQTNVNKIKILYVNGSP